MHHLGVPLVCMQSFRLPGFMVLGLWRRLTDWLTDWLTLIIVDLHLFIYLFIYFICFHHLVSVQSRCGEALHFGMLSSLFWFGLQCLHEYANIIFDGGFFFPSLTLTMLMFFDFCSEKIPKKTAPIGKIHFLLDIYQLVEFCSPTLQLWLIMCCHMSSPMPFSHK